MRHTKFTLLVLALAFTGCAPKVTMYQLVDVRQGDGLSLYKNHFAFYIDKGTSTVTKSGTYTRKNDTLYFTPIMFKEASEKDTVVNGKTLKAMSCARGELDSIVVKGYMKHDTLYAFNKKFIYKGKKAAAKNR